MVGAVFFALICASACCTIEPQGENGMTKSYVLAFDQGTTSSRAMLFDRDGLCVGTAQQAVDASQWLGSWGCGCVARGGGGHLKPTRMASRLW